jgi:hypothetical protein
VPDRTTVGRWWRRYIYVLEETFIKTVDMFQLIEPTTTVIVDSTHCRPLLYRGMRGAYWKWTIQRL